MTETELQTQITDLLERIAEHQTEIGNLETRQTELLTPPKIPAGATGQELAKIFEVHSGFDDEFLGVQAALTELRRRQNRLSSELQEYTRGLQQLQEQNRHNQLTAQVLAEITN